MTPRRFNRTLRWIPLLAAILLLAVPGSTPGVQPDTADTAGLHVDPSLAFCQFAPRPDVTSLDRSWRAVAASGEVAWRAPGPDVASWVPVRRGDRVASMSHVRAAARGQATLTRDGDVILVSPGSAITLPQDSTERFDVIRQDSGKALYKVKPGKTGRRFEVVTPMLVAGVKGTQFSVVVREGFVAVEVIEGHVEVQSLLDSDDRKDLFAGDLITMREEEGRMEMHQEAQHARNEMERRRADDVREIRKETRELADDLITETTTLDLDSFFKDTTTDTLDDTGTGTTTVTDTTDRMLDMLEEKQNQKSVDDTLKILSGGTVIRGTTITGN